MVREFAPTSREATDRLFTGGFSVVGMGAHGMRCAGELDLATAPTLDDWLDWKFPPLPPVSPKGAGGSLALDLVDLTFVDTAGVAALSRVWEPAVQRGAALKVTGPHGRGPGSLIRFAVMNEWLPSEFLPATSWPSG